MPSAVSIRGVSKRYASGLEAVSDVSLDIEAGEILALLGPNGAGKTTLISMICGITGISAGSIAILGHDVVADYRAARSSIGLVPQEVKLDIFARVLPAVRYTRALFGKPRDEAWLEELLRRLALWDKRDAQVRELSGGMMRRVLIAKALSHRPPVLFLDEPTAGVDVELRKGMWEVVRDLRAGGTTIILTTHYLEEAEAMADRVAVITGGRILLVEDKATLMRRMGRKHMTIELQSPLAAVPDSLAAYRLTRGDDGRTLEYAYDTAAQRTGIGSLLRDLSTAGLALRDVQTRQDSLEDIFVGLLGERA
ncbi:MAG TPA: ABC transporter ATP-binding protein [Amaricoccus sp.]|nr:ABC transporter ATP-binding protein [Amaricoccus sp.]